MHLLVVCTLLAAALAAAPSAQAAGVPRTIAGSENVVVMVGSRQPRQRDCVPTNGPFGFYGNIWCQPPNESSYLRNLGASWPMQTPPPLKKPRPSSNTDW